MKINDSLQQDKWLSSVLGYHAYKLIPSSEILSAGKHSMSAQIKEVFAEEERVFIYSKISTADVELYNTLEDVGFRVVDTNIMFSKKIKKEHVYKSGCKIHKAQQKDKVAVAKIAFENFIYSRFHLDPFVPNALANQIKSEWAGNFFSGERGDEMLVATAEDKVAGFLQLLNNNKELVIDLIAVNKEMHGKGVASDLIRHAVNYTKMEKINVGTQVANIPSIRLYEKLGFKAISSQYVLHYHSENN